MAMSTDLSDGYVWIEVISGVEGPSLYVCNENMGHRLAGPKPWGGGRVIHRFKVRVSELVKEATAYGIRKEPT